MKIGTFVDSGVLIYGARGESDLAKKALPSSYFYSFVKCLNNNLTLLDHFSSIH